MKKVIAIKIEEKKDRKFFARNWTTFRCTCENEMTSSPLALKSQGRRCEVCGNLWSENSMNEIVTEA